MVDFGPRHSSTHGVLRLILEIEGETVIEAPCGIGYLHTGIEKNCEYPELDAARHLRHPRRLPRIDLQRDCCCRGVEALLGDSKTPR